jgi:hypothetical protein
MLPPAGADMHANQRMLLEFAKTNGLLPDFIKPQTNEPMDFTLGTKDFFAKTKQAFSKHFFFDLIKADRAALVALANTDGTKGSARHGVTALLQERRFGSYSEGDAATLSEGIVADDNVAKALRQHAGQHAAKMLLDGVDMRPGKDEAGRLLIQNLLGAGTQAKRSHIHNRITGAAGTDYAGKALPDFNFLAEGIEAAGRESEAVLSDAAVAALQQQAFNKYFTSLLSQENKPPQSLDTNSYDVRNAVYDFVGLVNKRNLANPDEKLEKSVKYVLGVACYAEGARGRSPISVAGRLTEDNAAKTAEQLNFTQKKLLFGLNPSPENVADIDCANLTAQQRVNLFQSYKALSKRIKAELKDASKALEDPELRYNVEPPSSVVEVLLGAASATEDDVRSYREGGVGDDYLPSDYSSKSWELGTDDQPAGRKAHDPTAAVTQRPRPGDLTEAVLQAYDLADDFSQRVRADKKDNTAVTAKNAAGTAQYASETYAHLSGFIDAKLATSQANINALPADDAERESLQAQHNKLIIAKDAIDARAVFFKNAKAYYLRKSELLAAPGGLTPEHQAQLKAMEASLNLSYRDATLDWQALLSAKMSPVDGDPNSVEFIIPAPPELVKSADEFKSVVKVLGNDFTVKDLKDEDNNGVQVTTVNITKKGTTETAKVTYDPGPAGSDKAHVRARGSVAAVVSAYAAFYKAALQQQGMLDQHGKLTPAGKDYMFYVDPNSVELKRGGQDVSQKERAEFNEAFTKEFTRVFGGDVYQNSTLKADMALPKSGRQKWMGSERSVFPGNKKPDEVMEHLLSRPGAAAGA